MSRATQQILIEESQAIAFPGIEQTTVMAVMGCEGSQRLNHSTHYCQPWPRVAVAPAPWAVASEARLRSLGGLRAEGTIENTATPIANIGSSMGGFTKKLPQCEGCVSVKRCTFFRSGSDWGQGRRRLWVPFHLVSAVARCKRCPEVKHGRNLKCEVRNV